MTCRILVGDCREHMAAMTAESVHAIVTDPPYMIEFMGKEWDAPGHMPGNAWGLLNGSKGAKSEGYRQGIGRMRDVQSWHESWAVEAFRVLKPGGHLLAFGGPRTEHRMACAIEDAGFEIRDKICWLFGSGFPKGRRIDNAIMQEARTCLLRDRVQFVEQVSSSIRLPSAGAREPIALASARIQPEGVPALLTETGRADGSSVLTAISLSESMAASIALSTTLSWNESSAVDYGLMNKSTIATKPETTTILGILNSLPLPNTPDSTIPAVTLPSGQRCPVCVVVGCSSVLNLGSEPTPTLTALGSATDNTAKQYEGFNVALKPAYEGIIVARKPLIGTVAANVTEHGTGAINVDACRIGTDEVKPADKLGSSMGYHGNGNGCDRHFGGGTSHALGRWPANVVLGCACDNDGWYLCEDCKITRHIDDLTEGCPSCGQTMVPVVRRHDPECAAELLDQMSGDSTSTGGLNPQPQNQIYGKRSSPPMFNYGDTGGASRFFYTAKSSRAERNKGLNGMPERGRESTPNAPLTRPQCSICGCTSVGGNHTNQVHGTMTCGHSKSAKVFVKYDDDSYHAKKPVLNHHPTVKPVALMQWLVRLVTPPGGTVLDPFCGSGSTGVAADREGFNFIGIEQSAEYAEIARLRIIGDAPMFANVEVS